MVKKVLLPNGRPLVSCLQKTFLMNDIMAWISDMLPKIYLLEKENNQLIELPDNLFKALGGREEVVTMYGLLRLVLHQVKNGMLNFVRTKIMKFRMWGGCGGVEECFMTTPQLERITQVGAGTVKELSQMATAALVKEDWKGRGIYMVPPKWRTIFQMSMVMEAQIPALIGRHLMEAKKEKEGFLYGTSH